MGSRIGWWNMACWNGLSTEQQRRLIEVGNLPIGYKAEGPCPKGAEVALEGWGDEAPGPRFYCIGCAIAELVRRQRKGKGSIRCPRCGAVSHHPGDVRTGYCGRCHWWTSDPILGLPEAIAQAEREGALVEVRPVVVDVGQAGEEERASRANYYEDDPAAQARWGRL